MKPRREFGELEEAILMFLMRKKSPQSVKDVQQGLKGKSAYTTIMTVLSRLFEKGLLERIKESRSYLYSVKQRVKPPALKTLKTKFFSMSPSELFSYFLDSQEQISDKEIKKIERLIQEHKKKGEKL